MIHSGTEDNRSVCSTSGGSGMALRSIDSGISQRSNLMMCLLFFLDSRVGEGANSRSLGDGRKGRAGNLSEDRRVHYEDDGYKKKEKGSEAGCIYIKISGYSLHVK